MVGIPITQNAVSPQIEAGIRAAFRQPPSLPTHDAVIACADHAEGFLALLSDPQVHAPIYSLPRDLTLQTVTAFIEDHQSQQARGEGLLYLRIDPAGRAMSYSDIQVWPHWGACELGGAIHPNVQGVGIGAAGAEAAFDWLFEVMGIGLICETAAPDNIRTARLLDGLGFKRKGETISQRPDGGTRASLVWEMTREEWRAR